MQSPDQELYQVAGADRVFFSVPLLGYAVGTMTGPAGIFLLGLYAAFLISVLVTGSPGGTGRPTIGPPAPPRRKARRASRPLRTRRGGRLSMLGATAAVAVGVSFVSAPAWAMWSDPAPVSGPLLATVTPVAPVPACGALQLGSVTITWTPVTAATGYRVNFGTGGSSSVDVAASVTSRTFTASAGTFSVQALYGSGTWISAKSITKQYSSLLGLLGTCT